jgi:hypothetical protein
MKELFQAFETRIKSPLLGYFSIAFVISNWKAFFYLLASKPEILDKIKYFEANTDSTSLLWIPLLYSVLISFFYPWVNYFFLTMCNKPTELKNILQASSEHKVLVKKQELERLRTQLREARERDLINQAKIDSEIEEIEDSSVKEKLKEEITKVRTESANEDNDEVEPSQKFQQLTDMANKYRVQAKESSYEDREEFLKKARELESKAHEFALKVKDA